MGEHDDATVRVGKGQTAPLPGAERAEESTAQAPTASVDAATLTSGSLQDHFASGTHLGRYVILEMRGEGGMGVVYSAYDPKLDRRVALKLLRGTGATTDAGARLLREAQLLAKVSHPNVVSVYDCGRFGDLVFVEMEFVDGVTLREWAKGRSWREIVLAYVDAGRALEAVHRVGVIHRDFKPSNVIVDKDGRVRVLDFGIAHTMDEDDPLPAGRGATADDAALYADTVSMDIPPSVRSKRHVFDIAKTRHGNASGTPPYMPPEQWKGRALDARADQYAFAASLYRTLYDAYPFDEPSHETMATAKSRGPVPDRPAGSDVPGWVHRVLVRGLAYEAADRFPTMAEMLDALERDPASKLRRRVGLAAGLAAALAALVLGYRYEANRDARVCAATSDRLAGVWDAPKAARVHDAILASNKPGAEDTWQKTKKLLDAYAASWVTMRTEACIETQRATAATKDEAFGARLVCLDWRLQDLKSLTDVLASDTSVVHEATKAVMGLEKVHECTSPKLQAALRPPQDAAGRAHFEAVRGKIADASSRNLAGKYAAAEPIAKDAVADARRYGLRLAEGRALLALGEAQAGAGAFKPEAKTLEEAMLAAESAQDDTTVFWALQMLVTNVGVSLSDRAMADHWEHLASAVLERLGTPDVLAAALERARSTLARARAEYPAALAHSERSIVLSRRSGTPSDIAWAEISLGASYLALGRLDEAIASQQRGRKLMAEALGDAHPDLSITYTNEAIAVRKKGDPAAALALEEKALALVAAALGEDHPKMGLLHNNIAVALGELDRHDEQMKHYERSLAIREKASGPESSEVALALSNLGIVETNASPHGPYPHARERLERSLAIKRKLFGPEDRSLAGTEGGLAELSRREHKLDEAMAHAERAHALYVKKEGSRHPDVVGPLLTMSEIHRDAQRFDKAIASAEEALGVLTEAKLGDSAQMALARFTLAKALRAASRDPKRAREAAELARGHWAKIGNARKEKEISDWLAAEEAAPAR